MVETLDLFFLNFFTSSSSLYINLNSVNAAVICGLMFCLWDGR